MFRSGLRSEPFTKAPVCHCQVVLPPYLTQRQELTVDTGPGAGQTGHRGLSWDPPTPTLMAPSYHSSSSTSSIATAAVFTVYFHMCDLACHHSMLMLLWTKERLAL